MPRVKRGVPSRRRHKKILKMAKGFRLTHRTLFRPANEAVLHALQYAFRDRRARKRDMRKLWIARINAASRSHGLPYNQFMHGLKVAGVTINRKMLADLAVRDDRSFTQLVDLAKAPPAKA
jgi:large subunit ribosomal protein L20